MASDVTVPRGSALYYITKYPELNAYGYLRNNSTASKTYNVPPNSLVLVVPATAIVMVTNRGYFCYFKDSVETDAVPSIVMIYRTFLKL